MTPAMPTKLQGLAQELQHCSWDELQDRFANAMHERAEFESALQKETAELLEVGGHTTFAAGMGPDSVAGVYRLVPDDWLP